MVLKSVGVLSCAKTLGILYALFGLVAGAILSVVGLFAALAPTTGGNGLPEGFAGMVLGLVLGVGAVIVLPIFYGVMGFVGGLIAAWIYNLVAGFAGGVELELE